MGFPCGRCRHIRVSGRLGGCRRPRHTGRLSAAVQRTNGRSAGGGGPASAWGVRRPIGRRRLAGRAGHLPAGRTRSCPGAAAGTETADDLRDGGCGHRNRAGVFAGLGSRQPGVAAHLRAVAPGRGPVLPQRRRAAEGRHSGQPPRGDDHRRSARRGPHDAGLVPGPVRRASGRRDRLGRRRPEEPATGRAAGHGDALRLAASRGGQSAA